MRLSRRQALLGIGGALASPQVAFAAPQTAETNGLSSALRARAMAALVAHRSRVARGNVIGIVDFAKTSCLPRFYLLDVETGARESFLVAHGKGSDPAHSGWLRRFSNDPGSEASSAGAYLAGALYEGQHGQSRRLIGLDPSNSNAEARAIVIHGARYVSPQMAQLQGKVGRSQGCLAVSLDDIDRVLQRLAPGTLIYADRIMPV